MSYTLGLYEKAMPNFLSMKEKLRCAKECGFDYVELSVDESAEKMARIDMSKEERLQLISFGKEEGIGFKSMALSGHRKYPMGSKDKDIRDRSMEIMYKAIDLADDLGIRIIQLAGYDVYYEKADNETREYFIENLKKATKYASKKGVLLGFETMETEFMNTMAKAMEFVKIVNSPYLGVYPDIGNLTNASVLYKSDVLKDYKLGDGHIFATHLKETVPGVFREVEFGSGHVKFYEFVKLAKTMGINRFTAEMWYVNNDDWKEKIMEASSYLRSYLEREYGK